jgi:hypothetical protein
VEPLPLGILIAGAAYVVASVLVLAFAKLSFDETCVILLCLLLVGLCMGLVWRAA